MTGSHRQLSLWWDLLEQEPAPRRGIDGDLDVDVAIVGGGYTGLWTARSLLERDPSLRVVILEKEVCGYGASGRNGGWASALFAASDGRIARESGSDAAIRMRRAMNDSVIEIGRAVAEDGIDCHYERAGTIVAARSDAQVRRCRGEIDEARSLGFGEEDFRWLDATEAGEMMAAEGILGATYTPHCAAIQPARLAVGLAASVERRGARIFEHSEATRIVAGAGATRPAVITTAGTVRADVVVRATESWTSQLPDCARQVIPVYSLMIATEPLDDATWASIGLSRRQTFADHRHLVIYGQRTADGRIAFGGRGAPYHYNSAIEPDFDRDRKVFSSLRETLVELFPVLGDALITHSWGGPVGIPRDWYSSVGLDPSSGLAWAGGYVGDGVTTTNLAGRTLADLICAEETELTTLPWVQHRSPDWEPEPFRWLGVNTGLLATRWSDASERRRGKPSWVAEKMAGFLGG